MGEPSSVGKTRGTGGPARERLCLQPAEATCQTRHLSRGTDSGVGPRPFLFLFHTANTASRLGTRCSSTSWGSNVDSHSLFSLL